MLTHSWEDKSEQKDSKSFIKKKKKKIDDTKVPYRTNGIKEEVVLLFPEKTEGGMNFVAWKAKVRGETKKGRLLEQVNSHIFFHPVRTRSTSHTHVPCVKLNQSLLHTKSQGNRDNGWEHPYRNQGGHIFSVRSQIVNTLGFTVHVVCCNELIVKL